MQNSENDDEYNFKNKKVMSKRGSDSTNTLETPITQGVESSTPWVSSYLWGFLSSHSHIK